MNNIYRDGKYKSFLASDLDEAYKKGYFGNTMNRDELMSRITRYNPELRWIANKDYRGLFDVHKGFVCGIPHFFDLPEYSVLEYKFGRDKRLQYTNMYGEATGSEIVNEDEFEYKVLARGWQAILTIVEGNGYKIDRRGL